MGRGDIQGQGWTPLFAPRRAAAPEKSAKRMKNEFIAFNHELDIQPLNVSTMTAMVECRRWRGTSRAGHRCRIE